MQPRHILYTTRASTTDADGRLGLFLHFFDGFRTSHEIAKIRTIPYDDQGFAT